jgi:hypothetical protein
LPLAGREERGGRAPRFVLLRAIDAFSIRHTHTGWTTIRPVGKKKDKTQEEEE